MIFNNICTPENWRKTEEMESGMFCQHGAQYWQFINLSDHTENIQVAKIGSIKKV